MAKGETISDLGQVAAYVDSISPSKEHQTSSLLLLIFMQLYLGSLK